MPKPGNLPMELKMSINHELHNAELYRVLSRSAPNEETRRILEKYSRECKDAAMSFIASYRAMTGYRYDPEPEPVRETGSFRSVLRGQIRRELMASERYRDLYMRTGDNLRLRRAFFTASHNAMLRSVGIQELLM